MQIFCTIVTHLLGTPVEVETPIYETPFVCQHYIASVGTILRVSNVSAQTNGMQCPNSYTLIQDLLK